LNQSRCGFVVRKPHGGGGGGGSLRSDPSRRKRTGRRRDIIRKRSASAGVCVQSKHTHANGQQENLPKKKKIGEEKKPEGKSS
jgi:hypothetical protein